MKHLLAFLLIVLIPALARAHVGTPGTSAYCDCVKDRDGSANDINASSVTCTPGIDANGYPTACYSNAACKNATGHTHPNGTGIPVDPQNKLCEDYEAPTLTDDGTGRASSVGQGAPWFGPPWDPTGFSGWRGINSYWVKTYGSCGVLWPNTEPSTSAYGGTNPIPLYGATCTAGGQGCCLPIWTPGNKWNARVGAGGASVGVWKDSDDWHTEESSFNPAGPLCPDGSRGACDDTQVGGYHYGPDGSAFVGGEPGGGQTFGGYGPGYVDGFNGTVTTHLGYTIIYGYSPNIDTSSIPRTDSGHGGPFSIDGFKHDEFGTVVNGGGSPNCAVNQVDGRYDFQPFFLGGNGSGKWASRPIGGFIIPNTCSNACGSTPGTVNIGRRDCATSSSSNLSTYMWGPPASTCTGALCGDFPGGYNPDTDFPPGTVHCAMIDVNGMGQPAGSGSVKVWLDGKRATDITGMDLSEQHAINRYIFDGYINLNQNDGSNLCSGAGNPYPCCTGQSTGCTNHEHQTSVNIERYQDDITVREGPPLPCPTMFTSGFTPPPTFNVATFVATPSSCQQGTAACNTVGLSGTVTGTATGTEICLYDCDNTGGFAGLLGSCSGSSFNLATACSYAGYAPGTYTAEIRITRQGITATNTTAFQVTAPAAIPFAQGVTISDVEELR